jgi:hypothetical protein
MDRDGPNTSLRVFCRVDVGIFIDPAGKVSYFVNEVERGITTSLWVSDGQHTVGQVGETIVRPLKRWIATEKGRVGIGAQCKGALCPIERRTITSPSRKGGPLHR